MLAMLAAMTTAVGCKSDSSSNSGNNNQTEITAPSEQKRQIDVIPQFSSAFESSVGAGVSLNWAIKAEQLFKGELHILNSAGQDVEDSPFTVTVRMNETNWTAALGRTLSLVPGDYTLKMSLSKDNHQYYGEETLKVADGVNQAKKLTIHPIIGDTNVTISEIARLSHVQFRYPKSQLSKFSDPKLEINVNDKSQGIFAINGDVTGDSVYQYTESFIDLAKGENTIKLVFHDGNQLVGKSVPGQELRKDVVPGESFRMDLIPMEGKVNFEPLINGGTAKVNVSIPDEAVAEAGSAGNLKVRASLVQNGQSVIQAETTVQGSQSSYSADLTLQDVYYGQYKLMIEYFDKSSQERLGECTKEITLNNQTRTIQCESLKLRRNAVATGDLLASVHVTVLDPDGLPVKGAIVKLGETEKTTVGNDQFGTDSYGHFYEKPGQYTYTATFGGQTGSKEVTLTALQTKNLEITLDHRITVSPKRLALGYYHSCFLKENGSIKCWGRDDAGQLGNDSNTADSSTAVQVSDINNAVMISSIGRTTCALLSNGTVKCWGENNNGELGNDNTTNAFTPVNVKNLSNVSAIATAYNHSCALLNSGSVKCWGNNSNGELGDGSTTKRTTPVAVQDLTNVQSISAGVNYTCALLKDGSVSCWGVNSSGQLGIGNRTNQSSPAAISDLSSVSQIGMGDYHSFALTHSGQLLGWGENSHNKLGFSGGQTSPKETLSNLKNIIRISGGGNHSCALLSDGTARCWGYNGNGELGNESTTSSNDPVEVKNLSNIKEIATGSNHSCAWLGGDQVMCWGVGNYGRLGNSSTTHSSIPVAVQNL